MSLRKKSYPLRIIFIEKRYPFHIPKMTDFPTLSYNSTGEIPRLSYTLTPSLPECSMEVCKASLTFESADEIL